jgi:hypothetical protein
MRGDAECSQLANAGSAQYSLELHVCVVGGKARGYARPAAGRGRRRGYSNRPSRPAMKSEITQFGNLVIENISVVRLRWRPPALIEMISSQVIEIDERS